tara:strand:+ start:809 stop:1432 length:624 start_codon:yes stop_codon:yes gene_type:complete
MKDFNFFNLKLLKNKIKMKPKKILFLLTSLGLLSASTKPIFADEVLIAHAEVQKIVIVKYKPTKIKKVIKKKILPNGNVTKTTNYINLCKRTRIVKTMSGAVIKKKVKRNLECPSALLYNQKKIFSNHKSPVKSVNHVHYYPSPKVSHPIAPAPKVIDDNSCKEGSIIGGLLGAGITMSATRGKDRWWAVPVGGTAGALIGCQIDGG